MTELKHVERLRVATEAAGSATFGKELSASIADFVDLRFVSATAGLARQMLEDMAQTQTHFGKRMSVVGVKSVSCDIETQLVSDGVGLDAAAAPAVDPAWGLGVVLRAIFGGYAVNAGSNATGSPGIDEFDVTSGHASRWNKGGALAVMTQGALEAVRVTDIGGDTLTLAHELLAAPSASDPVYNAHSFYLADDPDTSLQWIVESADRNDIFWLLGTQLQQLGITLSRGELAMLSLQMQGASWEHDDDVAAPLGGSSLGLGILAGGSPIQFMDSCVLFGSAADARAEIDISEIQINPGLAYVAIPSTCGVNGVKRYRLIQRGYAASGQFTVPKENGNMIAYLAARDNRTPYALDVQVGNQVGNTALISLPRCQIVDVQRADSSGQQGVTVMFNALEATTDPTTEQGRSPLSIHCF